MLLKIFTTYNTQVVIENITNVEIHHGVFSFSTDEDLHNTLTKGPGVFHSTKLSPPRVEVYDEPIEPRRESWTATTPAFGVQVMFVDYEKDGDWHRAAIECFAYLCNDDGKTISKIQPEPYKPVVGCDVYQPLKNAA